MLKFPRYIKNLFVKNEQHLTRTYNKYVEYTGVLQIYISYSESQDKYELHLNLENLITEPPKESILIYDRTTALLNKSNTKRLIKSLDNYEIQSLWNNDTLEKTIELIEKYEEKEHNLFFKVDKTEIVEQIMEFIPYTGSYKQKPTGKEISNQIMISRRLYSTIFNSVTYDIRSSKYYSLRNKVKYEYENRLEQLKEELEDKDKLKYIRIAKRNKKTIEFNKVDSNYTYEDLIISIELGGESDLTGNLTIEDLLYEKSIYEENIKIDNYEYEIINSIKSHIYKHFIEYIKVNRYLKKNKKRLTRTSIKNYFKDFKNKIEIMSRRSGTRRKIHIRNLELEYGKDFKKFYESFKNKIDNKELPILIDKILLLDNHKEYLEIFNENELNEISRDSYSSKIKLKPYKPKLEETKHEKIVNSGFYDYKQELQSNEEQLILINEYIEELDLLLINKTNSDEEKELKDMYNQLFQEEENIRINIKYLDKLCRELWKELDNIPLHRFTLKYLEDKKEHTLF